MSTQKKTSTSEVPNTPKKVVKFQCGLFREEIPFIGEDALCLTPEILQEYMCDLLDLRFPEHPYGDLSPKILLYKHEQDDKLVTLTETDQIEDGMIIELVLTASSKQEYDEDICPHTLHVHSYVAPNFCDYCGVMLMGLVRQGLKCDGCGQNFHKRCAYKIPNNCTRQNISEPVSSLEPSTMSLKRVNTNISRRQTWSGRPLWMDRAQRRNKPQVPHTFSVHTYTIPTVCQVCKKLLKGLFRQGLQCKDCKYNCHKRCQKEVPKNCLGEEPYHFDGPGIDTLSRLGYVKTDTSIIIEDQESENGEKIPEKEDTASTGSSTGVTAAEVHPVKEPSRPEAKNEDGEDEVPHQPAAPMASSTFIPLQRIVVSVKHTKQPNPMVMREGWMVHYTNKSTVRKKYYWRLDTKCLTLYKNNEGAQYHKEIPLADMLAVDPLDEQVDSAAVALTPPHVFEIVTSSVTYYVGVDMTGFSPADLKPSSSTEDEGTNVLGDVSKYSLEELEQLGIGKDVSLDWEDSLHTALMPMTPCRSIESVLEPPAAVNDSLPAPVYPVGTSFRMSKRGSRRGSSRQFNKGAADSPNPSRNSFYGQVPPPRGSMYGAAMRDPMYNFGKVSMRGHGSTRAHGSQRNRGSFRVPKDARNPPQPNAVAGGKLQPYIETKLDISLFYQIFPDDVLGSGQFGTVYGGVHRKTSHPVAIKVIDKMRFPNKQESALRHEVAILQCVNQPGIVTLEQMFETGEKIYVVMEKMKGDMLEMILNSPESRLSERKTKFLIYQILAALHYLHSKDIVHCDLKPENVLLTSQHDYPQVKLCDFGFARIIGEKSFRKSIVGTPAYLAPEVLKSQGYNRSLDLWSVGVIIYVSLSGTFPFNEDEEIADQIQNAAFMYPPDPWATISKEAINLINKLLQVDRKKRYRVTKALHDPWLQDKVRWEDIRNLENRVGYRYLTHESEDHYWVSLGAKVTAKASSAANGGLANPLNSYINFQILESPTSVPDGAPAPSDTTKVKRTPSMQRDDTDIQRIQHRAEKLGYKVSTV
ncbi:serine/threonine-protein kinase D3-like [Dysidea avara]|uniref:serine/threonine-protein kinase D3-like n=1 Tax=Dysidea avara TaxID=196820 RepID=UPI00331C7EB3